MATMNNISAALDSRSMSVGRFILLGVLRCGLVHTPHELRTIIGPNRARTNPEMVLRRGPRTRLGRGWPYWLVNPSFPSHKQNATQLMQSGIAIFSFHHKNFSKPSADHLTYGVLMASIHPAGDSYNHRPSDLQKLHATLPGFSFSRRLVLCVWLGRCSREGFWEGFYIRMVVLLFEGLFVPQFPRNNT